MRLFEKAKRFGIWNPSEIDFTQDAADWHSSTQTPQSMHSSGLMTSMLAPSLKHATGQTLTQSVYLHLMQGSVTTKAIAVSHLDGAARCAGAKDIGVGARV